jgi:hypothetical protein
MWAKLDDDFMILHKELCNGMHVYSDELFLLKKQLTWAYSIE